VSGRGPMIGTKKSIPDRRYDSLDGKKPKSYQAKTTDRWMK